KILLRRATVNDRQAVIEVEAKSTPRLRYLAKVFDMFVSDQIGEFSVVEMNGDVVACGKFTIMPDESAWLETIRVIPEAQGLGIGKRLYQHFFDQALLKGVTTMRMYTGVKNVVSKGLAERFGFQLTATYRGAWLACHTTDAQTSLRPFRQITNSTEATQLLMPYHDKWTHFLVMNRTFYAITPALCADLAGKGWVYEEPTSGSVMTIGARFMPEQALHIGVFGGDVAACLAFALQKGLECGAERLSCLFPPTDAQIQQTLQHHGFQFEASDFIVMEVQV
ncbi:MAG: GNAT family N-acetyltransferase, partial [Chloroflexota bacterium]